MARQESGNFSREEFNEWLGGLIAKYGSQKKVCEAAGIPASTLNSIVKGKANPSIKHYLALKALADEPETIAIKRLGANSPVERVEGSGLPMIPVFGSAGAGEACEFWSQEPVREIEVLPQYAKPGCIALRVDGDSMEPTIQKGAYVGVVPLDGAVSEGGIYLVNVAPFGRLIKRVRAGQGDSIELVSDNRKYPPKTVPLEQYDAVVVGKVVWVWQEL